jgi:hypothetical protein
MPHTLRANSMIAVCMPRQMPKKGSPVSRAARIASTIPSRRARRSPRAPSRPSYAARISRARAAVVNRSLDTQSTSTPTAVAMPPCTSDSCTLL